MGLVTRAKFFATEAHRGQTRKGTEEPYITHPLAVWALVRSVPHTPEMEAAALLHDTVEDIERVTIEEIRAKFGDVVGDHVADLTDVSKPEDGNRDTRHALDREHSAQASAGSQTIKEADVIHNLLNIDSLGPVFARMYRAEKRLLLVKLTKGDRTLWKRAWELANQD